MCGRYTHLYTWRQLHRLMALTTPPDTPVLELRTSYNLAPSQAAPIVRELRGGPREAVLARWGLVPSWSNDPSKGVRPINARSETVTTSRLFRPALQNRRCVVPISGFYEWQRTGRVKVPHYIRGRGQDILPLAGLWERWGAGPDILETFTVLTTEANTLMRPLHDRMPVILEPGSISRWLDPSVTDEADVASLLGPCDPALLEAFPVSTWVNAPSHNDERCIEPAHA